MKPISVIQCIALLLAIALIAGCTQVPINQQINQPITQEQTDERKTSTVTPANGETIQLDARSITRTINGDKIDLYGYNGETPGPTLRVRQGSIIYVNFTNNLPEPTTIHWHGLRHNFKDDGVPGISQEPVKPGESFLYTLYFPDAGIFWYHPHVREDRQQDMGLYANILVEPSIDTRNPVQQEALLMIDDILLEDGKNVGYGKDHANFALMGRFGNTMLINGQTDYRLNVKQGETIRLYITNAANTRPFNLSIENTQLKIVGSDLGLYEKEIVSDHVVIGPAERYSIEVTFGSPGIYKIRNINMWDQYEMGSIAVSSSNENFKSAPDERGEASNDIRSYQQYFDKPVDEEIRLGLETNHGMMGSMMGGMKDMHSVSPIEWEDTMMNMNSMTTSRMLTWFLEDKKSKARNMDLTYQFKKGDVKKIRFVNDKKSDHPMQHMIHLHGQRFLVLEEDGKKNEDLVWKDTFLIASGSTVDILLDASNPGQWMMHCHIAEHLEAGMMGQFIVSETGDEEPIGQKTEGHQ